MNGKVNKIAGYRTMVGLFQKDIAKALGVSLQAYNAKENKKTAFKDSEKVIFTQLVNAKLPKITLSDIFFD